MIPRFQYIWILCSINRRDKKYNDFHEKSKEWWVQTQMNHEMDFPMGFPFVSLVFPHCLVWLVLDLIYTWISPISMFFLLIPDSSSDDSDSDLRVKNVSRLVMRPIGHSGKAKRGHLVFDAAYESGIIT